MAKLLTRYGNVAEPKKSTKKSPIKKKKITKAVAQTPEAKMLAMLSEEKRTPKVRAKKVRKIRNLTSAKGCLDSTKEFLKDNRKVNNRGKQWEVKTYDSINPPTPTMKPIMRKPMAMGQPSKGRGIAELQKRPTRKKRKR